MDEPVTPIPGEGLNDDDFWLVHPGTGALLPPGSQFVRPPDEKEPLPDDYLPADWPWPT